MDTRNTRNERMNADFKFSLNERETLSFTISYCVSAQKSSGESVKAIFHFLLFIRVNLPHPRIPRIHPSPLCILNYSFFITKVLLGECNYLL